MLQLKKYLMNMPETENELNRYAELSIIPCVLEDKEGNDLCAIRVSYFDMDKGELLIGTKKKNSEESEIRYVRERFTDQYSNKLNTFKSNSFYYNSDERILLKTLRWVETDNYGDAIISETYDGCFGAINPYNPTLIEGYEEINSETYKAIKEQLVREDLT